METPSPPDPRIGNVLQGRYRILSKIASGAMGIVYKGERVQLGRPVAVKFLHPWIAAQKAFLGRFENEAKAMSRLAHPNCVQVIDFGIEGAPFLVMDFVTGKTLREVLEQHPGRLPTARALAIVRQLLAGLAHAHAQGIVHRDLKPENLVLSEEEGLEDHLRILDFGLAKLRDGPAMTAGLAVGTPSYMSPEQTGAAGGIDARSDVYAVGVLLHELLAGQKPFVSEKIGDLILMHRETPPPPLRQVAPDAGFSPEIEAVVAKALAKFQDQRFQSASEMMAAIDATPEASGAATAGRPAGAAARAAGPPPGRRAADATVVDSPSAIRRIVESAGVGGGGATTIDVNPAGAKPPKAGAAAEKIKAAAAAARARASQAWQALKSRKRDRRLVWAGAALVAVVIGTLVVGRLTRHGEDQAVASTAGSMPAQSVLPAAHQPAGPESPRLEEARQLLARGDWEQAAAVLNRARAEDPDNAEAAYLLATTYLDNKRWSDGIAAAQVAVRKNPALKADADLIKSAIRSLVSDRSYDRSQAFLRSLGAPAVPFIKEAARHDESPKVRERAAELLQGGGRGWGSSSHSSGGSAFHR